MLCLFLLAGAASAQSGQIAGPRPLRDAAERLQSAWGRAVTYEEPLWRHPSDASMEGDPLRLNVGPRFRSLILPAAALQSRGRAEDAAHLKGLVDAFNAGNAPLAFGVLETAWGLHIVPVRSKDARGAGAPAPSLLETHVTISSQRRWPMLHVAAIAQAVSSSSGVRVESSSGTMGFGVNQLFLQEQSSPTIEWGAPGPMKARDALLDLLSKSATTLSWQFNCQPASPNTTEFCVLSVDPIRVQTRDSTGKVSRTVLAFDRCVRCKPLGPPPPKPNPAKPEPNRSLL
jgi:hypothetical protein